MHLMLPEPGLTYERRCFASLLLCTDLDHVTPTRNVRTQFIYEDAGITNQAPLLFYLMNARNLCLKQCLI